MSDQTPFDLNIVGCILAGGLSRRMGGGDKPLQSLGGKTMLGAVLDRLEPQVASVVINANGDPLRFQQYGLPVVPDTIEGFAGPLAGIAACMSWTADNVPDATHIVTVAADTPFFPADLVHRLSKTITTEGCDIALAASAGHRHPVFGLWPVSLRDNLAQWMVQTDTYKVLAWAGLHKLALAEFPLITGATQDIDPFFNVNSPDDLSTAEALRAQIEAVNPGMNEA